MAALLAGGPGTLWTRSARLRDPPRPAGSRPTACRSRRPSCSRPSRDPARSSRSAATTASTSTEERRDPPPAPLVFAKCPERRRRRRRRDPLGPGADRRRSTGRPSSPSSSGRPPGDVSVADALDHVLGYTCLNDVSARDIQFGDGQWVRGKSLDTFCPMGPALVTADEIGDPQRPRDLAARSTARSSRTSNTSRDVLRRRRDHQLLLAGRSRLEPGDVIATGTPGGVGVFRDPPRFLGDGDGRHRRDRADRPARRTAAGPRRRRRGRRGRRPSSTPA